MTSEAQDLAQAIESLTRGLRPMIVEARHDPAETRYKADGSAVTDLDLALEDRLAAGLQEILPGVGIVGEEGGVRVEGTTRWVIDPLDGTANFAAGSPLFGMQMALLEGEAARFSAIYEPMRDAFSWAMAGEGAWHEGRRLRLPTADEAQPLSRALLSVDLSQSGLFVKEPDTLASLRARVFKIRSIGSIALQLRDVALGVHAAHVGHRGTPSALPDLAPGALMVEEAGGFATDFAGRNALVHRTGLIAAAPGIHQALLDHFA